MLLIRQIEKEGKDLEEIRKLFREYRAELDEDICFQSFDEELKDPLKKYGSPNGVLFLADWEGEPAGCVALTPLYSEKNNHQPDACEMKRLFVRPAYRGFRIGRALAEKVILAGLELVYRQMKLDTLGKLKSAIHLYQQLGFHTTQAYYNNPIGEVVYMEKELIKS